MPALPPPRPGDPAPPFSLETPYGVDVSLRACLMESPVTLEFLRGTWDPAARERIRAYGDHAESFAKSVHRLLLITCEPSDAARQYLEAHPSPHTFLVDAKREVSRAYGIYSRFSFGAVRVAKPSTFLIDRCGFVRRAHVGQSPIDLLSIDALLAEFAEL